MKKCWNRKDMAPTHSSSSFQTRTRKHDAAGAAGVRRNKRHKSLRLILCAPILRMDLILTLTERAKKPLSVFKQLCSSVAIHPSCHSDSQSTQTRHINSLQLEPDSSWTTLLSFLLCKSHHDLLQRVETGGCEAVDHSEKCVRSWSRIGRALL